MFRRERDQRGPWIDSPGARGNQRRSAPPSRPCGCGRWKRIRWWLDQRPGRTAFVVTQFSTVASQTVGVPPLFMTIRTATKRATETMANRTRPRISICGAESTRLADSAIPRTRTWPRATAVAVPGRGRRLPAICSEKQPTLVPAYTHRVALDIEVQRLLIGDVILIELPDQSEKVEATVVHDITRTRDTVLATLRVPGQDDFVKEWPLGELVTVIRGP